MKAAGEMNEPRISIPSDCHLWKKKPLTRVDLRQAFDLVKEYQDDSHLSRKLVRCRECGHLFFSEFYEIIDWQGGNDDQYSSWIPVDDEASAERLNELSPIALLQYVSLRVDFPRTAAGPSGPYWRVPDRQ